MLAGALAAASLAACGDDDSKGGRKVAVALTDAGCSPSRLRVPTGTTTFEVTNKGTGAEGRARGDRQGFERRGR